MRFRWGIFGTGAISAKFVAGLAAARDTEVGFVASRSLARAERFAAGMGISRAIEGYAEAASRADVDAIYIATPPSEHANHALLCIEQGTPVLVEKPFAATASDARKIVDSARARSMFAMEAMWTRFLPAARALKDELSAGAVGAVRTVAGNFGNSELPEPANGNFNPTLGGGATNHLGVYPLSLAQWLFGSPTAIHAIGSVGATGVDEDAAFQLRYPGGEIGSFFASIRSWAPNDFHVMGTEGRIDFRGPIFRPHGLNIRREEPIRSRAQDFGWRTRIRQHGLLHRIAQVTGLPSRGRGKRIDHNYSGNGYHYEAEEVRTCVQSGATESAVMPLDDSISVVSTLEVIRRMILESSSMEADKP